LKPRRNFGPGDNGCGPGAWELAARYSVFDANSKDVAGGVLRNVTLGVNWYWNPNTKVQFNYIHAMPDTPGFGSNTADIFAVRMAYDF
jgi:phosphate-selective porin OprO/OprP